MTHHIIRSEAGRAAPHVLVRVGRRRRRALGPVQKALIGWVSAAISASLFDSLIGAPVGFVLVAVAFAYCSFRPGR